MAKLNKNGSTPLYQQLMEEIKTQILSASLKENDRIPTEIELSQTYDVSRITVRKAIALLVEEEILIKRQGIGTFVAEKKMYRNIGGFMGFTQNCMLEGTTAGAILISAGLVNASIVDIEQLKLKINEKIISIIRVRTCDGVPVMLEENHFPSNYAFLLSKDLTGSLYHILEESGVNMARGIKQIGICQANAKEEKYLGVSLNKALLIVKDLNFDKDGIPIHNTKCVINPDRYKMTLML